MIKILNEIKKIANSRAKHQISIKQTEICGHFAIRRMTALMCEKCAIFAK